MLSNERLIQLLEQEIKKTHKIYWLCYDWKHEGLKPLATLIEDILFNAWKRKWCRQKIKLLRKNLTTY